MPRRTGQRGLAGRASLTRLLATVGALLALAAPAHAEQAKAGRFVQEGMQAMWAAGMALPDGDAAIHMETCDVGPRRAICRLRVSLSGHPACGTVAVLSRGGFRFPARLWECPRRWRPVFVPMPDGLTYPELLEKRLAR